LREQAEHLLLMRRARERIGFPIRAADLTAEMGSVVNALSTATWIRIFHNPAPGFGEAGIGPPPIVATLGVDNITAVAAVPEPATALLTAGGFLAGWVWRRTGHRRRVR
jgi:hypothetical protein